MIDLISIVKVCVEVFTIMTAFFTNIKTHTIAELRHLFDKVYLSASRKLIKEYTTVAHVFVIRKVCVRYYFR